MRHDINNLPVVFQLDILNRNGICLQYIEEQTEQLCKAAIDNVVHAYETINNPSEEIEHYCLNKIFTLSKVNASYWLNEFEFKYESSLRMIEIFRILQ